jgi:acyl-coenzyme A synthetase/AMP-(fatty) acid ligase
VAFVVAPNRSAREIVNALRQQLEPAFVPRRVVHVAALPREATGKLTAATLRSFAIGQLTQAGQAGTAR